MVNRIIPRGRRENLGCHNPAHQGALLPGPGCRLALSGAPVFLDLARYQSALQTDSDRRRVGHLPAADDHGDFYHSLWQLR